MIPLGHGRLELSSQTQGHLTPAVADNGEVNCQTHETIVPRLAGAEEMPCTEWEPPECKEASSFRTSCCGVHHAST